MPMNNQKEVFGYDECGKYIGPVMLGAGDLSPLEDGVWLLPANTTDTSPPSSDGMTAFWIGDAWELRPNPPAPEPPPPPGPPPAPPEPTPVPPAPEPTQFERDQARYEKRAAVKDQLIAYMAADNMSRVRSEVWTVEQLASLMDDPAVAAANAYMGLLAFELAAEALAAAQTPLLTPEIRADWIARLETHFYLEG